MQKLDVRPGRRFGRLTILREGERQIMPSKPGGRRMMLCRCDCGNTKIVRPSNLTSGTTRSCGCLSRELLAEHARSPENRARLAEANRTHGRSPENLARLAENGRSPGNLARLAEHARSPENLARLAERARSPENRAKLAGLRRTHGLYDHPLYSTWRHMVDRCENPRSRPYENYGGRDIQVCPEWHDVAAFIAWIEANLGPRPDGMSLDRTDNDGNYEPGNVRWATAPEQRANQRRSQQRHAA